MFAGSLVVLFVVVLALARLDGLQKWIQPLNQGILQRVIPLLVFVLLAARKVDLVHALQQGVIYHGVAVSFLVGSFFVFLRLGHGIHASVYALGASFTNSLLMGVPLFGFLGLDRALDLLLAMIPLHAFLLFSTASLLNRRYASRSTSGATSSKPFKVPTITYALVLGQVLGAILGLGDAWSWVGQIVIAIIQVLSIISLGIMIARSTWSGSNVRRCLPAVFTKVIVFPIYAFSVLWVFKSEFLWEACLIACLPTGFNVMSYAADISEESLATVAQVVLISTLISAVGFTAYFFFQPC